MLITEVFAGSELERIPGLARYIGKTVSIKIAESPSSQRGALDQVPRLGALGGANPPQCLYNTDHCISITMAVLYIVKGVFLFLGIQLAALEGKRVIKLAFDSKSGERRFSASERPVEEES
jgi:hypothetical protein